MPVGCAAVERGGHGPVPDRARLEELGFFACETDLEDELIRALGVPAVEAVIEEQGELMSLRILQRLRVEDRLRLTTEHFMVLPAIVRATDLAVIMPRNIALGFAAQGGYAIVEPPVAGRDFTVSLHWSRRFEAEPGNAWLRERIEALFREGD